MTFVRHRQHTPTKVSTLELNEDDRDADQRAASLDAIETVQVIAALLAGTGIAFLDNLEFTTSFENESTRVCVLSFIGLNMYGLIILSTQLFYLRQCMAKDTMMFDPFMKATKDTRYIALKGVLYSMVVFVGVLGMRQFSFRGESYVAEVGGVLLVMLAVFCLRAMRNTREAFATLRKKSKARIKLKSGMDAVRVATSGLGKVRKANQQQAIIDGEKAKADANSKDDVDKHKQKKAVQKDDIEKDKQKKTVKKDDVIKDKRKEPAEKRTTTFLFDSINLEQNEPKNTNKNSKESKGDKSKKESKKETSKEEAIPIATKPIRRMTSHLLMEARSMDSDSLDFHDYYDDHYSNNNNFPSIHSPPKKQRPFSNYSSPDRRQTSSSSIISKLIPTTPKSPFGESVKSGVTEVSQRSKEEAIAAISAIAGFGIYSVVPIIKQHQKPHSMIAIDTVNIRHGDDDDDSDKASLTPCTQSTFEGDDDDEEQEDDICINRHDHAQSSISPLHEQQHHINNTKEYHRDKQPTPPTPPTTIQQPQPDTIPTPAAAPLQPPTKQPTTIVNTSPSSSTSNLKSIMTALSITFIIIVMIYIHKHTGKITSLTKTIADLQHLLLQREQQNQHLTQRLIHETNTTSPQSPLLSSSCDANCKEEIQRQKFEMQMMHLYRQNIDTNDILCPSSHQNMEYPCTRFPKRVPFYISKPPKVPPFYINRPDTVHIDPLVAMDATQQ